MKKKQEQKYRLTVTEHQLRLIAACVEDLHRFMGGQMEMSHTVSMLDNWKEIEDKLRELHPLVVPNLPFNACYGWSGGSCTNDWQRKFLAETYCIYREIIHRLTVENHKDEDGFWNVYLGETLTCEEGGELPKIEKL